MQADKTCIMIDCGFSTREVEKRLLSLDVSAEDLSAIVVTHEHSDHIKGVARLARKYDLPVWMTAGTARRALSRDQFTRLETFSSHDVFSIDSIELHPFPVPHDAQEPAQFVFSDGRQRLGLLTDSGSITPHIKAMLDGIDGLLLETNYDHQMLMEGPYPQALKARVASRVGHLSNDQAAELLQSINCENLQYLVAMHISEKNNHEDYVYRALAGALDGADQCIEIACQEIGFHWKELKIQ